MSVVNMSFVAFFIGVILSVVGGH